MGRQRVREHLTSVIAGNALPGAEEFVDRWSRRGPSHPCAIGVGHVAGAIEKLGALLAIPVERVC